MYLINLDQPGTRRVDHFVEGPCCPVPDPTSDTIFVAGLSRERDLVYMINGATGTVRNQAKIGQLALAMVIDPHLQLLFVVNNRTPSLPIIKTTTGALLHTVSLPATPSGLAADLVSRQLFVSTPAGLTILRSTDGNLITQLNAEYIYGAPFGGLAILGGIGFDAEAQRVVLGYRPSHTGPSSFTILDSRSHAIVARHTLLGEVMAVRMHPSKHHTYVLFQTRDYAVPRETRVLTLQIWDTRTGSMLHEEVVGKHPLDVLFVESRNQLFIADFDEKAVVCVEDLLP